MIMVQADLSISRQCELLQIPRSTVYYQPVPVVSDADVEVLDLIDRITTAEPYKRARRLVVDLKHDHDLVVNRKRMTRLMQKAGITPVYPKPKTTKPEGEAAQGVPVPAQGRHYWRFQRRVVR